ncbi:MAG TPA: cytochrome c [Xanthomonadales bacterium]|nr:cytochrome c [Xanthomonadales bacterium]
MPHLKNCLLITAVFGLAPLAFAAADPAEERHERMEAVGDAVAPLGGMLKGELEFSSTTAMASLMTIKEKTTGIGDLFPEGSYVEGKKRATQAVWTNRADFDQKLGDFNIALDAAIAANPQSVDELKPVFSGLIDTCKACHEEYRSPGD